MAQTAAIPNAQAAAKPSVQAGGWTVPPVRLVETWVRVFRRDSIPGSQLLRVDAQLIRWSSSRARSRPPGSGFLWPRWR
jgi:hypothetical protein